MIIMIGIAITLIIVLHKKSSTNSGGGGGGSNNNYFFIYGTITKAVPDSNNCITVRYENGISVDSNCMNNILPPWMTTGTTITLTNKEPSGETEYLNIDPNSISESFCYVIHGINMCATTMLYKNSKILMAYPGPPNVTTVKKLWVYKGYVS